MGGDGPLARGQAELATHHPGPDRAEQDPADWWPAVVDACARARGPPERRGPPIAAIGLRRPPDHRGGARPTTTPIGPAIAVVGPAGRRRGRTSWAAALGGAEAVRQQTGQSRSRATSVAAKLAWLAAHEPDRLGRARWVLAPRDLLVWQLTGTVATDPTLASASGCYDRAGRAVD